MSQLSSTSGSGDQPTPLPSLFDTYLCTEPAGDVPLLIRNGPDEYTATMRTLQRSADYFAEKDQGRAVERLQWEMAKVHMQHSQWDRATRVLEPLWQTISWRRAGWWQLLAEVDWALRDCASHIRNLETLIAVEWELLNRSLTPKQEFNYNFSAILKSLDPLNSRPKTIIKAESVVSCVSAQFAFSASEGNVGVPLQSQILISSKAHVSSHPLVISQVKVKFGGNLRNFTINHKQSQAPHVSSSDGLHLIYQVPLQTASPEAPSTPSDQVALKNSQLANDLVGFAELRICPGATKALSLSQIPRDAGEVEVASLTLCMNEDDFDLEVVATEDEQLHQDFFWTSSDAGPIATTVKNSRSSVINILPKPPKIRVELRNLASTYFTDETIALALWIVNEEDEAADVTMEARIIGSGESLPHIVWTPDDDNGDGLITDSAYKFLAQKEQTRISKNLGTLAASAEQSHGVLIQALPERINYIVEARAQYFLLSDPETLISKHYSTTINVNAPFEISYSSTPLIDHGFWPSYFSSEGLDNISSADFDRKEKQADGLKQKWRLASRLYSLVEESLSIDGINLQVLEISDAAVCNVESEVISTQTSIPSNDFQEHGFILNVQKADIEDRQTTYLELRMKILWRRQGAKGSPIITYLAVPELIIPFGEPRVLATARNGKELPGSIHLVYIIENPSAYALSFNLTMESSEEFAFSGPKNIMVELLPLSRHTVRYNLLPMLKGAWISPQLRVFDTHFQKALNPNATEGIRSDKKGLSIWVDADG